ncbi:MAG: hypothetical protein GY940_01060, partial [bacterium]|nr:hypothetical protein [bacterium]
MMVKRVTGEKMEDGKRRRQRGWEDEKERKTVMMVKRVDSVMEVRVRYGFAVILLFGFIAGSWGCSTIGKDPVSREPALKKQPVETKQKEISPPQPPGEDIINDELPILTTIEKKAPYLQYEKKRYNLDLQSGDIKDVLLALVRGTDIGLVIDPGITGHIPVMDLKDSTLKDILSYILVPLNLKYKWEGKNI